MKQLKWVVLSIITVSVTAFSTLSIWNADPAHSEIRFSITHLGISDVTGTFNDFKAAINSSKEDFSDAVLEATINVASIDTRIEARDKHLKSADFFDVEKFSVITFKSTQLQKAVGNQYTVTGNLTAKGITKPVVLNLEYRGTIENPMSKKPTAGFKLTGIIKRSDFGIGTNFPAPMLSDEVVLDINGEFQQ